LANNWNNEVRMNRLIGSLTGAAKLYYMSIMDIDPALTWEKFQNGLKRRFTRISKLNQGTTPMYDRISQSNRKSKRPNLLPLQQLPNPYNKALINLVTRLEEKLTELKSMIEQMTDLLASRFPEQEQLHLTKSKQKNYYYSEKTKEQPYTICYFCNQPGHVASHCIKKNKSKNEYRRNK
jgi:hypothetical protein